MISYPLSTHYVDKYADYRADQRRRGILIPRRHKAIHEPTAILTIPIINISQYYQNESDPFDAATPCTVCGNLDLQLKLLPNSQIYNSAKMLLLDKICICELCCQKISKYLQIDEI